MKYKMWLLDCEIIKISELNKDRLIRRREKPFEVFYFDGVIVEIGETENVYYMKIGNQFWFSPVVERFYNFLNQEEENENKHIESFDYSTNEEDSDNTEYEEEYYNQEDEI